MDAHVSGHVYGRSVVALNPTGPKHETWFVCEDPSGGKVFRCTRCVFARKHLSAIRVHVNDSHGGREAFGCTICDVVFDSRREAYVHLEALHVCNEHVSAEPLANVLDAIDAAIGPAQLPPMACVSGVVKKSVPITAAASSLGVVDVSAISPFAAMVWPTVARDAERLVHERRVLVTSAPIAALLTPSRAHVCLRMTDALEQMNAYWRMEQALPCVRRARCHIMGSIFLAHDAGESAKTEMQRLIGVVERFMVLVPRCRELVEAADAVLALDDTHSVDDVKLGYIVTALAGAAEQNSGPE